MYGLGWRKARRYAGCSLPALRSPHPLFVLVRAHPLRARGRARAHARSLHAAAAMAAVLPWLTIGGKAEARDRALLHRLRVRYVLNVTPPRVAGGVASFFEKEEALEYLRLPLRDLQSEALAPHLPPAAAFLERARVRADGAVLVHCNEGKSRSAAVIAAYLVTTHGLSAAAALAAGRRARPAAAPNAAFARELMALTPRTAVPEAEAAAAAEAAAEVEAVGGGAAPSEGGADGKRPREEAVAVAAESGGGKRAAIGPSIPPHLRQDDEGGGDGDGEEEGVASIGPSIGPHTNT